MYRCDNRAQWVSLILNEINAVFAVFLMEVSFRLAPLVPLPASLFHHEPS